jgi:hypothetical protein
VFSNIGVVVHFPPVFRERHSHMCVPCDDVAFLFIRCVFSLSCNFDLGHVALRTLGDA